MNLVLVQYSISKHDTREGKKNKNKDKQTNVREILKYFIAKKIYH